MVFFKSINFSKQCIGLLTLKDYLTVSDGQIYSVSTNYLNNLSYWWLETGNNSWDLGAYFVGMGGFADSYEVYSEYKIRPAVVLNPRITITNVGSSTNPYTIEQSI